MLTDILDAYKWMKDNTPKDARIMAWWDYGYQINGIGNRTSIADGNTWNFEHIALLARTLLSPEKEAWGFARYWADYVLVWTGRNAGMYSDEMSKMPQLARISGSRYKEIDPNGYFCDDKNNVTPLVKTSLLWKLFFYGKEPGIKLEHFEEVYTSKYQMMRIFKIKDVAPRHPFGEYHPVLKAALRRTRS